jgi:hypothetical protein
VLQQVGSGDLEGEGADEDWQQLVSV